MPTSVPVQTPSDSAVVGKITEKVNEIAAMNPSNALKTVGNDLIRFGFKVLLAILIYIIGAWLIKKIKKMLVKLFSRKNSEKSLASFITSLVSFLLTVLLIIVVISVLGIDTTSFAAVLASLGLAIGMAMSGTLQNFAGGVMILTFKPFKVGDFIEVQGYTGTVSKIEITQTTLITPDNRDVIIPNGTLQNGNVNNYSKTNLMRAEWNVAISYGDDFDVAQKCILDMLGKKEWILHMPEVPEEPYVVISELGDNGVILLVRCWTTIDNYWIQKFRFYEDLYRELPKHGISFPFPQVQVHSE